LRRSLALLLFLELVGGPGVSRRGNVPGCPIQSFTGCLTAMSGTVPWRMSRVS